MSAVRSRGTAALALGLCLAVVAAGVSGAEVARKGDVTVTFSGSIAPRKLPRQGTAPIGVQMGGKIRTTNRDNPPILDRIVLDINRNGRIQQRGLATCPLRKLKSISSEGARKACRKALIGRGSVTSRVSLPDQGAFASRGKLLAFNGRRKGRRAVFAQVASGAPLPLTYVIVFEIRKRKGRFGTRLIGKLPPIASSYGYISAFNLSLRRTYRFRGKRRSFASAGCPAAKGFPGASFSLARASYIFKDGRKVSRVLIRQCRVRR